ncbi:MAG: DUF4340 domain-containing protein [bacterium]
MKLKNLFFLLASVVILVVILLVVIKKVDTPITDGQSINSFFSNVNIEEIGQVVITNGDKSVNIKKKDNSWIVEEASGYYADFSKLKKLIVQLISLRSSQKGTKNKKYFKRLKVEAPTKENPGSILVSFKKGDGTNLAQLIFGDKRKGNSESPNYRSAIGQYVRVPDSDQVYIITENIQCDAIPENWIKKEILDINEAQVQKVVITNLKAPKKPRKVIVQRQDKKDVLKLVNVNIPAKKKVKDAEVKKLAGVLNSFSITDVVPVTSEEVKDMKFDQSFTVSLFEGIMYNINLFKKEDKCYAKVSAEYLPEEKTEVEKTRRQEDEKTVTEKKAKDVSPVKSETELKEEVRVANEEYSQWIYVIGSYKYDQMTKKKSDFLEPIGSSN